MLKWLSHLYQKVKKHYSHPTLAEWIEKHEQEQVKIIQDCNKVIKLHRFQKHMAWASIQAMNDWKEEGNDAK